VKSRDIDARIQANASVLSEGVRTLNGAVRVADHIQVNSGWVLAGSERNVSYRPKMSLVAARQFFRAIEG